MCAVRGLRQLENPNGRSEFFYFEQEVCRDVMVVMGDWGCLGGGHNSLESCILLFFLFYFFFFGKRIVYFLHLSMLYALSFNNVFLHSLLEYDMTCHHHPRQAHPPTFFPGPVLSVPKIDTKIKCHTML